MTGNLGRPDRLRANAWDSAPLWAPLADTAAAWAVRRDIRQPFGHLAAPPPADPCDWRHPNVGWGVILPDNDALSPAQRATADDAAQPIRDLVSARGGVVLRYREDLFGFKLQRCYPDGTEESLDLSRGPRGVGPHCLPTYLLIAARPDEIPWDFQYTLAASSYVGRLDLPPAGLQNYVAALLRNDAKPRRSHPVVWATDHGVDDITWLMRRGLAEKVRGKLAADPDTSAGLAYRGAEDATASALAEALSSGRPAFVLTTSHGSTSLSQGVDALRTNLGDPISQDGRQIRASDLLKTWQPNGAIWVSHACCAAGSDDRSQYRGLFPDDSQLAQVLDGITKAGAMTAPLPRALLGAKEPLAAFVGHVEPTFNWTLRDPDTGQLYTDRLVAALYDRLHQASRVTLGHALRECHALAAELIARCEAARRRVDRMEPGAENLLLHTRLAALDNQSLVILGDPAVSLPPA